jgi:hypothetical protein
MLHYSGMVRTLSKVVLHSVSVFTLLLCASFVMQFGGDEYVIWLHLTGILFLTKNWGGGGWLKRTPDTAGHLTEATSSISDKQDILMLRAREIVTEVIANSGD